MTTLLALDATVNQQPFDFLKRLRTHQPVCKVTMFDGVPVWLVTRYTDARQLLADPRLNKNLEHARALFPSTHKGAYSSPLDDFMLQKDPPDHTRLRRLVAKAFTAHAVDRLTDYVNAVADDLLDRIVVADEPVDLLAAYAAPLPIKVIGHLLGVPVSFQEAFRDRVIPMITNSTNVERNNAAAELTTLLTELIEQKRSAPTPDLLSALIAAADGGDRLTDHELLTTAYILILAGYETTVNLIGNGMHALLRHPDQLRLLREKPDLLPNAIEELLRYDGPINVATLRFTTEPVDVAGVTIPASEIVMISLLSANRDSQHYANPDQLDITRNPGGHLAFGHGIHYCLGAPLARLEGRIAIAKLLERFTDISLAGATDELYYRNSSLMHGLTSLPVRLAERQT